MDEFAIDSVQVVENLVMEHHTSTEGLDHRVQEGSLRRGDRLDEKDMPDWVGVILEMGEIEVHTIVRRVDAEAHAS